MDTNQQKIDFNLRHYIGNREDVLKHIQLEIKNFLKQSNTNSIDRSIYSAIYNAIAYYEAVSNDSLAHELSEKTFLNSIVDQINSDYQYLSDKYNAPDSEVIRMEARIKSPISAVDKIVQKANEYIEDGRDLRKLNFSLRDFVGIKIIIDPPPEIKAQGDKAELDYCYDIAKSLMEYHGIQRQLTGEEKKESDLTFIPVNTEHIPDKLTRIKERIKEGYTVDPKEVGIYIPTDIPEDMKKYEYYFKDYIQFPKKNLYQRIHTCAYTPYKLYPSNTNLPNYIIPPKNPTSQNVAIEYQICTQKQNEWAETGEAAHTIYKDRTFHRLGIPIFISKDINTGKFRLDRLDESMEKFYGYSFKDLFNIDYQDFLHIFNSKERDDILAGTVEIEYSPKTNDYTLKPTEKPIIIYDKNYLHTVKNLLSSSIKGNLKKFYDENNILENTIYVNKKERLKSRIRTPNIKAYSFDGFNNTIDLQKGSQNLSDNSSDTEEHTL